MEDRISKVPGEDNSSRVMLKRLHAAFALSTQFLNPTFKRDRASPISVHYEGNFEVISVPDRVYLFITNSQKIASIFPDVSELKIIDDENFTLRARVGFSFFRGTMDVKLNWMEKRPVSLARLKARATGMRSTAELEATFTFEEKGQGTRIGWTVDAKVSGTIASVGSRIIDIAAEKYTKQIISSLQQSLS